MAITFANEDAGLAIICRCSGTLAGLEAGGKALESHLNKTLRAEGRFVILNLSAVTYLDSLGLSCLVSSTVRARNSGGDIILVGLTKRVEDLFTITKLSKMFQMFESEAGALNLLKSRVPSEDRK